MKRLTRTALSADAEAKLTELTRAVVTSADPKDEADSRWRSLPKAFREIRKALETMASGRSRCMYCEDSLGTDIDHFWPKGNYPNRAFQWANYLLACSHCNSNQKRNLFPLDATGTPLLIDPTAEDPRDHLTFSPSTGRYVAFSPKGDKSIEVFGLNDDVATRRLPTGRKQAFVSLVALLRDFQRETELDAAKAAEIRSTICEFPFNAVFHWLVAVAQSPNASLVLPNDIVELVRDHDLASWL